MFIYLVYTMSANLSTSVITTWQLQTVKTGYVFPSVINVIFPLFVAFTSAPWGKVLQKIGNFKALALVCAMLSATYFPYAFVTHDNYLWLMLIVRLAQHGIGMLQHYSVNNLIYINLPEEDQTCYTSFYTIIANLGAFASMSIGTWVVASMGGRTWNFLGHELGSVPVLLFAQGVLTALAAAYILLIRKWVEPKDKIM